MPKKKSRPSFDVPIMRSNGGLAIGQGKNLGVQAVVEEFSSYVDPDDTRGPGKSSGFDTLDALVRDVARVTG